MDKVLIFFIGLG